MLDLFIAIVRKNGCELGIVRGIDPLTIPIDGLELFSQRIERAIQIARGLGNKLDRFVISHARLPHKVLLEKVLTENMDTTHVFTMANKGFLRSTIRLAVTERRLA